jgi:hypothetical protein
MRLDSKMVGIRPSLINDSDLSSRIKTGVSGRTRWWAVGGDRVELRRPGSGWAVRVRRADWNGVPLDVDGHFGTESEAVAWCEKMANVLAEDQEDEDGPPA